MEDLIKVIAFLIIMAFTGLSTISKKMRERQKDLESENPAPLPKEPWSPKKNATKPPARPSPATPFPANSQPASSETAKPEEPIWAKMLREMMDMNEPTPQPVFVPDPPPPPVDNSRKLARRKKADTAKRTLSETKPVQPSIQTAPATKKVVILSPQANPLTDILARAQSEPMRAAVLLSEIIQPPRAKRRHIRPV